MYETRGDISVSPTISRQSSSNAPRNVTSDHSQVCVTNHEYYGLISGLLVLLAATILVTSVAFICYRRLRLLEGKTTLVDHPVASLFQVRPHTSIPFFRSLIQLHKLTVN